ncbi:MAG: tetratricopeptide repeat protein [Luteolibacter sp.]
MSEHPTTSAVPSFPESNPLENAVEKNQKGLLAFALIVILAAGGYGIYRTISEGRAKSAGEALTSASGSSALASVTTEYPNTPAAGTASILLADSQWAEGKKDEAIATLEKLISAQPQHPLLPTAQVNLADKLAATGKTDEATALFEKVAGNSAAAYIAPYALISLGDLAKSANQPDKAKESYQRVQNDFPNSPFAATATQRLLILNAKAPVEIDAPPAAPAAKDSDVPEANLLAPSIPSTQIPFGSPSTPTDDGTPKTPDNP